MKNQAHFSSKRILAPLSLLLCLFYLVASAPISSAGIFGPSSDTKKNVIEIKKLGITEGKLLSEWNSVIGPNYQDDYTTGMTLIALAPKINDFISRLDALNPKDAKLRSAVNLWIDGWNKQAEGVTLAIAAIDEQDYAKMARSNAATAAGRKLIKKAQQAFAAFIK